MTHVCYEDLMKCFFCMKHVVMLFGEIKDPLDHSEVLHSSSEVCAQ